MDLQLPFLYRNTARGYICFFVGVIVNYLLKRRFNKKLVSILGMLIIGILLVLAHKYRFSIVFGNITYSFCFFVFPILLISFASFAVFRNILSIRPLVYLGNASMSIYLMHLPVYRGIRLIDYSGGGIDVSSYTTFVIILLLIITVSILEYELFEKRLFPKYIPKLLDLLKRDT